MMLGSKVVKIDLKIIISLRYSKSVTHFVAFKYRDEMIFLVLISDVGDRRSDVQRGGILRDHADDLEASERSRKELAPRL